jgi:fatty-acyl-CoA synthase
VQATPNPHTATRFLASDTLPTVWRRHAREIPDTVAISHWSSGGVTHRYTWSDLVSEAEASAAWLIRSGVRQGDVCALVLRPAPRFFPIYMGVMLAGALPSVLAYPNERLHPDKFRQGIQGIVGGSGLNWLVTDASLLDRFSGLLVDTAVRIALVPSVIDPELETAHVEIVLASSPDDPCLVQHSSGTTGLQKSVTLSHRAILEHSRRYGQSIHLSRADVVATWLPLYHDMGLIAGFHLPLSHAVPIVQLDPFEWVSRPAELLLAIAHERATLCWMPNFAFNLLSDRIRSDDIPPGVCESVRLLINCSEPVRASSIRKLVEKLAPYGLRNAAIGASFAMAEATFAVTQTTLGTSPAIEVVSRSALADGVARPPRENEPARDCVSSGRPVDGCRVRVVNEAGDAAADGTVGSIEIMSLSLFSGYRDEAVRTANAFRDGWFVTGDLGFQRADELFVIGRLKDLIIVGGRNIYPEDVEDAISRVEGVIAGRVVAFEKEDEARGTGRIAVIAESLAASRDERADLRLRIVRVGAEFDFSIGTVFLAPPRWLIKSSSGKLSRRENAERADQLREDAPWKTNESTNV